MNLYKYPTSYSSSCCSSPVCTPDYVDSSCSLNSIRQTLLEIINAVKNTNDLTFNVDIEIKTKNGIITTLNFSNANIENVMLNEATLVVNDTAISLCDIVKINIVSSSVTNPTFTTSLLNSLKNITTNCYYPNTNNYSSNSSCLGCNSSKEVKCTQGMQNFINQNMGSIQSIGYNGGLVEVQEISAINNVDKVNVIETANVTSTTTPVLSTANINTQTVPVVNNATLNTQTTPVLKTITTNTADVVSNVNLKDTPIITELTPTTVSAAAPLSVSPESVVSSVTTSTENSFVSSIQTAPQTVVTAVTPTTDSVVTSVPTADSIDGVISGVTTPQSVAPRVINIPRVETRAGQTGDLYITIPARSIDGTNPTTDLDFNVQVDGSNINFGGNTASYVLPSATNIIGYTAGSPVSSTVTQIGTPTTDTFVKSINSTTDNVVKTVTPQNVSGKIVTQVNNATINNVDTPQSVTVLQSVNSTPSTVNTVSSVDNVKLTDLFTTTTANVLSSANLNSTTANVLSSANLNSTTSNVLETVDLSTTSATVVNDFSETTATVYTPSEETIQGKIFAAGDGIMAVNNTNGDISVYSICDINTITS